MNEHTVILVLAGAASVLSGAILLYWLAALIFIWAGQRAIPRLETGLTVDEPADGWPLVSIVMPAHDEQRVIDEALAALRASDYARLQIIVVADRCTDDTIPIVKRHAAEDGRIEIVQLDACPEGWTGKCHASWQGATRAKGDWLLFTDADTLFQLDLVRASVGLMLRTDGDFLSLLGSLSHTHEFERIAQPVAAMLLMTMYPLQRANRPAGLRRRPFANGQFMMFRRSVYQELGTHEAFRHGILEDLVVAGRLNRGGYRMAVTVAPDRFKVRMYGSWEAFRRGWKRILCEAANRNRARLTGQARRLRVLAVTPFVLAGSLAAAGLIGFGSIAAAIATGGLALAAITMQITVLAWAYRLQGAPLRAIIQFPLGCLRVASILTEAVADLENRRGIEWAELRYDVGEKRED